MAEKIIVIVEGGVVQNVFDIPQGVEVEVRDYDTDQREEGDRDGDIIRKDKAGDFYRVGLWLPGWNLEKV